MSQFQTQAKQVEEAAERLERERAALLRPDGQRRYSDQEHAEREQALLAAFNAAADRAFATVDEAVAQAQT